jgi:hypothetical protein
MKELFMFSWLFENLFKVRTIRAKISVGRCSPKTTKKKLIKEFANQWKLVIDFIAMLSK